MEYNVKRSYSPAVLNFFLNHSEIYPFITPDGAPDYLDGSEVLARPDTYFFHTSGVGLLLWKMGGSLFQGDIYALTRKRGTAAKEAAKEAIRFMFSETPAEVIEVRVPRVNKVSQYLASSLGFKRKGIVPAAWIKNGITYDTVIYGMEKWAE